MKFNVLIFVIILSCSKQKINLNELSGYWEIDFIKKNNEKYIPKPSILQYDHYTINNSIFSLTFLMFFRYLV